MSTKKQSRLAQRNNRNDEPTKEVVKSEPVKEATKSEPVKEVVKPEPVRETVKSEQVEQKKPEQRRLADIVSPSTESHFVPHEDPSISDWSQESVKPLEPINEIPINEQSTPIEPKKSVADFDRAKIATLRASIESVTGKLSYDDYLMLLIQLGEEQKNLDISLGCERLLKKINREFNENAKKRNQFGNNNQQRKPFDKSENVGDMTTTDNSEPQQSGFRGGFRGGRGSSTGFRGGRGGSFNRGDDGFKNDSDGSTNSPDSFKPRENHNDGGFKPRENHNDGGFKPRENNGEGSFRGRDTGFRGGRGGFRNESSNPDGNSNNGFKGSIQNETNESNNDNGFKGRGGFRNESNNGDGSGFRGGRGGGFRSDSNNGDGSGFRGGRGGGFRSDSNNGDGSRGRGGFRGGEFKSKFNSRNDN
jgi:hypothetical protein